MGSVLQGWRAIREEDQGEEVIMHDSQWEECEVIARCDDCGDDLMEGDVAYATDWGLMCAECMEEYIRGVQVTIQEPEEYGDAPY